MNAMNAIKIPTSLHLFEYLMLNERSKNSSVFLKEQNLQSEVESGLVRYPPAREMYGSMYCEQVKPEGGLMVEYSTSAQVISCPPSPKYAFRLNERLSKEDE